MGEGPRLGALDGLRGVAAVVVLLNHGLQTFPLLAEAYYGGDLHTRVFSPAWLITYTPLHLFWLGTEAVYLFFVLSGIVLVLPVLEAGRRFVWLAYFPRRIIRIYLPVVAAVALGGLVALATSTIDHSGLGGFLGQSEFYSTPSMIGQDLTLVLGASGVVGPLWSLQWEVLFSLLLGLYVLWADLGRRWWWAKLVATFAVIAVGYTLGIDAIFYLAIFAVGSLLVVEWDRIGASLARLGDVRWGWPSWLGIAVLLATVYWWMGGVTGSLEWGGRLLWLSVLGVAMLVLAGAFWRPATTALTSRVCSWLGRISFSLYLVHEPIIISVRLLTRALPVGVSLAMSLPAAVLVAVGFSYAVEQPAHRLSQRVGRAVRSALRRDPAATPPPSPLPSAPPVVAPPPATPPRHPEPEGSA